ncbi:hypothetical protein RRG08_061459 [Elysia crispata]|uniref:Uncharacterized protein n=2 Tax=Elysia crispata TaxID=231223 RepID=A0AAE0YTT2_9GAST|nr:hypothetical protein RRG08_061459 [Elysia crispata]
MRVVNKTTKNDDDDDDDDKDLSSTNTLPRTPLDNMSSYLKLKKPKLSKSKQHKEDIERSKAELRKLNKLLAVKKPVTQDKLVTLMGITNVPLEKFKAYRIDVLIRQYMNDKQKEFTEMFKRIFFTGPPPFAIKNKVSVSWENDMKGLMKTALDIEGLVVKQPTQRLQVIIGYCNAIIKGAFETLDEPTPGLMPEVVFVNRVNTFNSYTLFINNICQNLKYSASSLIFTYFYNTSPRINFNMISDTLSDISHGSRDVEEVLLNHVVEQEATVKDYDIDKAARNPYNVVAFSGYPFEQVRPALRAEYVLLKLLFYFGHEYGTQIKDFIKSTYRRKFNQIETVHFAINNVLQLFPGLMTIMFYMINLAKDSEGVRLLYEVNHKFKWFV